MAPTQNKGLIFAKPPTGFPKAGEHLKIEDRPIDLSTPPPEGGLLVENLYASYDPYQRGRMRDASIKSYSLPYPIGEPLVNSTVSRVLASSNPEYSKGDLVLNYMAGPIEEYSVWDAALVKRTVRKLEDKKGVDPVQYLGALGMPGLTAYSSFYEIGKPKKGETIFISSASGAVGQIVGQLAKHEGLTVIGSVGDDAKAKYITEDLKFDAAFNYKKEKPADALKRLAPNGIDIYYENVGGEHLEAALDAMNNFGRVIACGMISQYNAKPEERYGVPNLMLVVARRLTIRGFIVSDEGMGPKYHDEHQQKVAAWLQDGSFAAKVHITDGIDNAAEGLIGIFHGENFGKPVLKIKDL